MSIGLSSDEELLHREPEGLGFIAGFLQAQGAGADLADLRALLRPRLVEWRDPTDWMGNVVQPGPGFTYSSSDPNVVR